MTADDERELWIELTTSKGWTALQKWASETWTPLAIMQAANDTVDASALEKLRQVIAANRAVTMLLDHPQRRLKQLDDEKQQAKEPQTYSRRGGL